jgi:class 3 adenylate cyclase
MSGKRRNLGEPDEVIRDEKIETSIVRLGDLTVGRSVQQPGWRWTTHVRPKVSGDWCQARHVGVVLSGRLHSDFSDGSSIELGPDDVFDIAPGHAGYVVGDEALVTIEWEGLRTWYGPMAIGDRVVVTLLFTDLVGSTKTAGRIGEQAWGDLMARHNELVRRAIDRHRGREVDTTGDGFLVSFDGAGRAIRCAIDVRAGSADLGLEVRAGIHTGEVDVVGKNVRGIAVHEAARVAGAATAGEILVSEVTRALAAGSEATFGPGTPHDLKGIEGERVLYPVAGFA